jgi:hypothetical protein
MAGDGTTWQRSRSGGLTISHRAELGPDLVIRAIRAHRCNVARGRDACEQLGPGSSVSRVLLEIPAGRLDLAVKWNHWRGWRGALGEVLRGSRAKRAVAGARRLDRIGLGHPRSLALAERRRCGVVRESYLLTSFLIDAVPLPAIMPALRTDVARRRALASQLGEVIGRLHAGGLDHSDLKHSNLMVRSDDTIALLDLDTLVPPRRLVWRRRVRALGQLEAYARDLAPWLSRGDRLRFLRAYLRQQPDLVRRRGDLVRGASAWAERRLAVWARKDRRDHIRYPLAPRGEAPPPEGTAPPDPRPASGGAR